MQSVKDGDLDKLGLLFERYHHRLFGYFFRMTSRRDVSEDLVQGVFERILKYRSSYSGESAFSTWIYQIARNLHADYYRSRKRTGLEESPVEWDSIPSNNREFHNQSDTELDQQLVQQALQKLSDEKKQVLILNRFEGFTYREIAEITASSENAVKVRAFRALRELKKQIMKLEKSRHVEE